MSNDNLDKMPYGFDYYQDCIEKSNYTNDNSLVRKYDLSKLKVSYNYNDSDHTILPEIAIKFKDDDFPVSNINNVQKPPMVLGELSSKSTAETDENHNQENAKNIITITTLSVKEGHRI